MSADNLLLCKTTASRRSRVWYVSPEGFRELRRSCGLSRQACAAFLGVGLRTVYHWEAGRCRTPFSAVRLLRLLRMGDLGALHDSWAGWRLDRLGLHDPAGRHYDQHAMRFWWITCEQARFWREGRPCVVAPVSEPRAARAGSRGDCKAVVSGSSVTAVPELATLLPAGKRALRRKDVPKRLRRVTRPAVRQATPWATTGRTPHRMGSPHPSPAEPLLKGTEPPYRSGRAASVPVSGQERPAGACAGGQAAGANRAGAAGRKPRLRQEAARSAPAGAGLVSSSKQVRSQGQESSNGAASEGATDAA